MLARKLVFAMPTSKVELDSTFTETNNGAPNGVGVTVLVEVAVAVGVLVRVAVGVLVAVCAEQTPNHKQLLATSK
jgi:hypothetical protein